MKKSYIKLIVIGYLLTAFQIVYSYIPISDEQLFELTPLMFEIDRKDYIAAKTLIQKGVDVNELSTSGGTALMLAARMASLEMVEFLLKSGAKPNNCGLYDYCPLWYAVDGNSIDIVKMLVKAGADPKWNPYQNGMEYPPLHIAARKDNIKIVRFLVEAGADIEYTYFFSNDAAETPLAVATAFGNLEIIKYLLSRGAKIHEVTEVAYFRGQSALDYARTKGFENVVSYIENGLIKGKFIKEHKVDDYIEKLFKDLAYVLNTEKSSAKTFLNRISMGNLKLLRNAIFARKNYKFNDVELTKYYLEKFPSYKPSTIKINVNGIDKMNIKFIKQLEQQAYSRSIAS